MAFKSRSFMHAHHDWRFASKDDTTPPSKKNGNKAFTKLDAGDVVGVKRHLSYAEQQGNAEQASCLRKDVQVVPKFEHAGPFRSVSFESSSKGISNAKVSSLVGRALKALDCWDVKRRHELGKHHDLWIDEQESPFMSRFLESFVPPAGFVLVDDVEPRQENFVLSFSISDAFTSPPTYSIYQLHYSLLDEVETPRSSPKIEISSTASSLQGKDVEARLPGHVRVRSRSPQPQLQHHTQHVAPPLSPSLSIEQHMSAAGFNKRGEAKNSSSSLKKYLSAVENDKDDLPSFFLHYLEKNPDALFSPDLKNMQFITIPSVLQEYRAWVASTFGENTKPRYKHTQIASFLKQFCHVQYNGRLYFPTSTHWARFLACVGLTGSSLGHTTQRLGSSSSMWDDNDHDGEGAPTLIEDGVLEESSENADGIEGIQEFWFYS